MRLHYGFVIGIFRLPVSLELPSNFAYFFLARSLRLMCIVMKKMSSIQFSKKPGAASFWVESSNNKISNRRLVMKKLMLVSAIVLGTVGMSMAQNTANQAVTINAAIIQGLTLSVAGGPLNLGTIVAGTTPAAVDPHTSPIQFTLTGNGTSVVTVQYSSVTLNGPASSTLTFTPTIDGAASSANQATAASVANNATVTLGGSNYSAQSYYFWLGGSVGTVGAGQTPGAYTGTFTLTVHY